MPLTVADIPYDKTKPLADIVIRYAYSLQNCPGFSIVALQVTYPPNGATPPHRHGGAAVSGLVLSGKYYTKMNNGPTQLLEAGEAWHENPGCHHQTSANASASEPVVFLANLVVETEVYEQGGLGALVVIDEEWR